MAPGASANVPPCTRTRGLPTGPQCNGKHILHRCNSSIQWNLGQTDWKNQGIFNQVQHLGLGVEEGQVVSVRYWQQNLWADVFRCFRP